MGQGTLRVLVMACAVLLMLGGEPAVATPRVTTPPPPDYGSIGMSWYMDYTGSKGGTQNPYRQLWPSGGVIPLEDSEWRCEHSRVTTTVVTLPARGTKQVYRVPEDTVELTCTYGGRSVTSTVRCVHNDGEMQSRSLSLSNADGKSFHVALHCAYLTPSPQR